MKDKMIGVLDCGFEARRGVCGRGAIKQKHKMEFKNFLMGQ